jgi:hypothetical protein
MKYWISLIAIALSLNLVWAQEQVAEEKGNKGKQEKVTTAEKPSPKGNAYGLDKEFQNNMPEEVRARVEALKAAAAEMRKAYKALIDLDPEAAKAKREEIRATVRAKRDAILEKLSPEEVGKVKKILEDVDRENQGKGEEMRKRQRAIQVLLEKLEENPDHKGLQNALSHVQKSEKPQK